MEKATKYAIRFLSRRQPEFGPYCFEKCPTVLWYKILDDFILAKGEEALQALAGFYIYAIDHIKEENKVTNAIAETFSHDLGGMNDEWCLPRSNSYLEFWKKEMDKHEWN